jgi:hypothetical protein
MLANTSFAAIGGAVVAVVAVSRAEAAGTSRWSDTRIAERLLRGAPRVEAGTGIVDAGHAAFLA